MCAPSAAWLSCVSTCIVECCEPGSRVSRQLSLSMDEVLGRCLPKVPAGPFASVFRRKQHQADCFRYCRRVT